MGKATRRAERAIGASLKDLRKLRKAREIGPCWMDGCKRNGDFILHCQVCEELAARKQDIDVHRIQTCPFHHEEALGSMKEHIARSHPARFFGRVWAQLFG